MRTRTSLRNQDILFKELFKPEPAKSIVNKLPICANCKHWNGSRNKFKCKVPNHVVYSYSEMDCFSAK